MLQVLHYLSRLSQNEDPTVETDSQLFSLTDQLGKGSAIFRENYQGQNVAVKIIGARDLEQLPKLLLHLSHPSVVKYLEFVTEKEPQPRSFVIMELCRGTVADYLEGKLPELQLETSDFLWQLSSALEYLHSQGIRGLLEPEKVLLTKGTNGQPVLKLQVSLDNNFSAEGEAGDIFALGELTELVADSTEAEREPLFDQVVLLLQQQDKAKRPSLHQLLSHPYLLLNRDEARQRLSALAASGADFLRSLNTKELSSWYSSVQDQELKNEEVEILEALIEQFSEDADFTFLLNEGRQKVPLLLTHFLYHATASHSNSKANVRPSDPSAPANPPPTLYPVLPVDINIPANPTAPAGPKARAAQPDPVAPKSKPDPAKPKSKADPADPKPIIDSVDPIEPVNPDDPAAPAEPSATEGIIVAVGEAVWEMVRDKKLSDCFGSNRRCTIL